MGRRKQQRHQQHSDKKRAVRVTRYDMCMNGKDKGVSLPTILVLGDGDFSFSCALIKHRKCADGLTCTSIDSEDILHDKYPNSAPSNIQQLKSLGATVLHGVDATRPETLLQAMSEHLSSQATLKFDRVIFNFPHIGKQETHLNRNLLRDFLSTSSTLLTTGGQVHITLKLSPPYDRWNVEELAQGTGMVLGDELSFDFSVFPGFSHQTTKAGAKGLFKSSKGMASQDTSGTRASKGIRAHQCRTFVFVPTKVSLREKKSVEKDRAEAQVSPKRSEKPASASSTAGVSGISKAKKTKRKAPDDCKEVLGRAEKKKKSKKDRQIKATEAEIQRADFAKRADGVAKSVAALIAQKFQSPLIDPDT